MLELTHQLTNQRIFFCYGQKAYKKVHKVRYNLNECIAFGGRLNIVTHTTTNNTEYIIGVKKGTDIYEVKGMIVHELSHLVTELMEYQDIKDDEYRSYTMQWLYIEVMQYLDKVFK